MLLLIDSHIENLGFIAHMFKRLYLRKYAVDFVEICSTYVT